MTRVVQAGHSRAVAAETKHAESTERRQYGEAGGYGKGRVTVVGGWCQGRCRCLMLSVGCVGLWVGGEGEIASCV